MCTNRVSLMQRVKLRFQFTDNFAERLPSELNLKLDSRSETAETVSQNEDRVQESGDKYK